MAKLSELKKVELLEAAITANDIETVRALYAEHGNFEFTPRALSLACRNGTPELVRVLCENDATFEYEYTPALAKKYDCKIATSNRDSYPKNYNRSISQANIHEPILTTSLFISNIFHIVRLNYF